jgi:hypothetical protein
VKQQRKNNMNTEREAFEKIEGKEPLDKVSKNSLWKFKFYYFNQGWQAALANKPEAEPVAMRIKAGGIAFSWIDYNQAGYESLINDSYDMELSYLEPPSNLTLQKRIKVLEAQANSAFDTAKEIFMLSANRMEWKKQYGDKSVVEVIDSIKAGDMQAPKEGWKLVPIEPTDEMIEAGIFAANGHKAEKQIRTFYKLFHSGAIAAAPTDTE